MKTPTLTLAALLCLAVAAFATVLPPVLNLDGFKPDESSIGLWVKFDSSLFGGRATKGSPTGLFGLRLLDDGRPEISFRAEPTEILGDFIATGRDAVSKGEWHHFEITYSRASRKATFFVDGHFQWENDCLNLPRLLPFAEKDRAPVDFHGEVRGLCVWDAVLESEAILPAGGPDANALDTVLRRRDAARTKAVLAAVGHAGTSAGALYVVSPTSPEPYLPYDLPRDAAPTNVAVLVSAPGELEDISFLFVAKRPLTIREVRVGDFTGEAGTIPGSCVDTRLVKRWMRSGGAWLSYHSDRRQRNLTPDLLIYDDDLIRVDELRRRNYIRLTYPEGVRYVDVSDPDKGHVAWKADVPFEDAKTLQPVKIDEAGRNQQFLLAVDIPADTQPGLYTAPVTFVTDKGEVSAQIVLRLLDVALPAEPSPYRDLDRVYVTHMNHFPLRALPLLARTLPERRELAQALLDNIARHHVNHTTDAWNTDELAAMALKAGFIPDRIHGTKFANPRDWKSFFQGVNENELTLADREAGMRASMREKEEARAWFAKTFPQAARQWSIYVSESSWYQAINWKQEENGEVAHRLGQRVFAHGGLRNTRWGADVQDMHSSSQLGDDAAAWSATGGEMINYADPFPGAENPLVFRYLPGWMMYRSGFAGHMLHGWLNERVPFNEWAEDYGGDGNYRNFAMVYPQRGGVITTLAWEGILAGYNDLRWLTRLRQIATAFADSDDHDLRTEAKRQLRWLDTFQPYGEDVEMIRAGAQRRILVMQDAVRRHGAELPPPDRAYRDCLAK